MATELGEAQPWGESRRGRNRLRRHSCLAYALLVILVFGQPLVALLRYAASHDLHSHIVLIPGVAAYLLLMRRRDLPAEHRSSAIGTAVMLATGASICTGWFVLRSTLTANDNLAFLIAAFLPILMAGGFLFLGSAWMQAAAFPMAVMFFMVPLPDFAIDWLERAAVLGSAEVTSLLFRISGTSCVREGAVFELPGIVLQVAQECSGIRSSLVLFITSLLASYLFLKNPWRRLALVAFVIPLGILRNGFRVFVIGLLCVHVGPHMIDSPIHRQGGPVFFALSLIPLFVMLWWLRRGEQRRRVAESES